MKFSDRIACIRETLSRMEYLRGENRAVHIRNPVQVTSEHGTFNVVVVDDDGVVLHTMEGCKTDEWDSFLRLYLLESE